MANKKARLVPKPSKVQRLESALHTAKMQLVGVEEWRDRMSRRLETHEADKTELLEKMAVLNASIAHSESELAGFQKGVEATLGVVLTHLKLARQ